MYKSYGRAGRVSYISLLFHTHWSVRIHNITPPHCYSSWWNSTVAWYEHFTWRYVTVIITSWHLIIIIVYYKMHEFCITIVKTCIYSKHRDQRFEFQSIYLCKIILKRISLNSVSFMEMGIFIQILFILHGDCSRYFK